MRWANVNSSMLCSASLCNTGLKRMADQVRLLLFATDPVCRDFIRTDLQVCITLAWVAETAYDSGNPERAARVIATAEKGYSTLLRFFSRTKHLTPEAREELQLTFNRLRERLDGLQRS
jgi:hypothetical protein